MTLETREVAGVAWRAWYVDGRTYDSRSCRWRDLPDDGALGFRIYFLEMPAPDGLPQARVMSGSDYYFCVPGVGYFDSDDEPAEIRRRYLGAIIKRGKWTTDREMIEVNRLMMDAREF